MAFRKDPAEDNAREMVKRLNQQTKHGHAEKVTNNTDPVLGEFHKDVETAEEKVKRKLPNGYQGSDTGGPVNGTTPGSLK
jgi:hypothetical protein